MSFAICAGATSISLAGASSSDVLSPVFERADEILESRGQVPLPTKITTHKLRHAFASVLIALGVDPISVMSQIGHTDPTFTMRVYVDRACSRWNRPRFPCDGLVSQTLQGAR